jgi:hypothetical protein
VSPGPFMLNDSAQIANPEGQCREYYQKYYYKYHRIILDIHPMRRFETFAVIFLKIVYFWWESQPVFHV